MMKWILSFLILVSPLLGLYNGNPSFPMMPEEGVFTPREWKIGVKVGYQWDRVFSRPMEGGGLMDDQQRQVNYFRTNGQYGSITFNAVDRVELYGLMGSMSLDAQNVPLPDDVITYGMSGSFVWSLGGRAILAYWGDAQLGMAAAYLSSSDPLTTLRLNGLAVPLEGAKGNYQEWQVGASLSYRFAFMVPYAGVKYTNARANFSHLASLASVLPMERFMLKNGRQLGIFIGFGIGPEKGYNLNVEGRFINETALTLSGDIRF